MAQKFERTFEDTLLEVARENAQALETKAHTAASLMRICPGHCTVLRRIEARALEQAFCILAGIGDGRNALRAEALRIAMGLQEPHEVEVIEKRDSMETLPNRSNRYTTGEIYEGR